jgi:hypothetical protein
MGGKPLGFSDYEQTTAINDTKRAKFLADMDFQTYLVHMGPEVG